MENKKPTQFLMKPKVDFCFKELMEDEEVRNAFLAAVLGINLKEINESKILPSHLRQKDKDDKLGILNFIMFDDEEYYCRKYPKPTEEEITKAFQVERQARIDLVKQQELPEDVKLYQEMEGQESTEEERDSNKQERDLSGSILDCMERYHTILSKEQKEIMIESLEKGLTEEQVKHLMFYPAEKMYQYQRAFLLQNSSQ